MIQTSERLLTKRTIRGVGPNMKLAETYAPQYFQALYGTHNGKQAFCET